MIKNSIHNWSVIDRQDSKAKGVLYWKKSIACNNRNITYPILIFYEIQI